MSASRFTFTIIASVLLTGLLISLRIRFNHSDYLVHVKKKTTVARITINNDSSKSISTKVSFPDITGKWDLVNDSPVSSKDIERFYLETNYTSGKFGSDESFHGKKRKAFDRFLDDPNDHDLWPQSKGWHSIDGDTDDGQMNKSRVKNGVLSRKKRAPPCERGEDLDDYVDDLFRFAQTLIRIMEPFSALVPNMTIDLPEYNLIIFLYQGGATNVNRLERKKPAWIQCSNDSTSLGMTIKFQEIRITYKMRVIKDWELLFDGAVHVQLVRPKVQVQFTQNMPPVGSEEIVQQRIDALRIWSVDKVRIMIKGLGNITSALSMFLTRYINMNLHTLLMDPRIYDLELMLMRGANNYLMNSTIDFFNLV